jgi:hypothetical protein
MSYTFNLNKYKSKKFSFCFQICVNFLTSNGPKMEIAELENISEIISFRLRWSQMTWKENIGL